jgi:RNA polymerase sigma-70 factor (ECF subfamily)
MNTIKNSQKIERQVIIDLKKGDDYALKHLYTLYSRRIFTMGYGYFKSKEDTEELVQEVFIKLWKYRNNIDPDRPLEAYLFRIAKNEIISFIRKRKINVIHLEDLQIEPQGGWQPDMIYSYKSAGEVVKKIIQELSERTCQVFLLRRVDNLSNSEIAKKMSVSVKTVENHIPRAQNFLKSRLRDEEIL